MGFSSTATLVVLNFASKFKLPTRRFLLLLFVIVWINAINFFVFHHRHQALDYLTNKFDQLNPLNNYEGHAIPKKLVDSTTVKYWLNEAKISLDPRRIEIHSLNYDSMFSVHPLEQVLQLLYNDRCDAFFKSLFVSSEGKWVLDSPDRFFIDMEYEMSWDDYKKKYQEEFRSKLSAAQNKKPEDVEEKHVHEAVAKVYDGLKDKAKKDEKAMLEQLAIGRVFSKCYVARDDIKQKQKSDRFASTQARLVGGFSKSGFLETDAERKFSQDKFPSCADLEQRVIPWLSYQFPVYESFSGQVSKTLPKTEGEHEKRDSETIHSKLTGNRPCWLSLFKNNLSGKGIAIPFDSFRMDETVSLIRLLRALDNKLPIQIVSYGQLEEHQKQVLSDVAREPIVDLPSSYSKVAEHLGDIMESPDRGLRPQDLWYVDALSLFEPGTRETWTNYPLSILATFASSFEEVVLMDPTVVPLKNPEYFFGLKEYQQKGAYFYRAKPMHKRKEKNMDYFNRMTPSLVDTVMFNIPILTDETLSLPFFEGLQEMQDASVAVIDKKRHFDALTSLLQLGSFWPADYRGSVGQELWLGFIVAGDEAFHFNKYYPAALGDSDPFEEAAPQVCSTHTGHLDPVSTNQLVWMTGGYAVCPVKDPDVSEDFGRAFDWNTFDDPDQMVKYYKSRFNLKVGIVPPYENPDSFELKNNDGNPVSPWQYGIGCLGKVLCANGEIGGSTDHEPNTQRGQLIEFDPLERNLHAFYGDIYMDVTKDSGSQ